MKTKRFSHRRAGYTLLEITIGVSLMLLVTGGVSNLMQGSQGAFRESVRNMQMESTADRALTKIVRDLRSAGEIALDVGATSSTIPYQPSEGWEGGAEQLGDARQYVAVLAPGELANGVDDNGDGRVDEWELEHQLDDLTLTVVRGISNLAEGEEANGLDDNGNGLVDEAGFTVVRDGNIVTLRITVEAVEEGRLIQSSAERDVYLKVWN